MFSDTSIEQYSEFIKEKAISIGFDLVGIADVEEFNQEFSHFQEWINAGYHGSMGYMATQQEKRKDITLVLPEAESVIVVGLNYYTDIQHKEDSTQGKISRYAWGTDYHEILPAMMQSLSKELTELEPNSQHKFYVDTGPILEKQWAVKAGLGWQGKHSNIINRAIGSWFFIGVIISTIKLSASKQITDYCGTCTACIDACPTNAIIEPYKVDATKCISYWTIETKPDIQIPDAISENLQQWVFGCDICQEVCPWNTFQKETNKELLFPRNNEISLSLDAIVSMTQEEFSTRFKKSPIKRTKLAGLKRNAEALLSNNTKDNPL